MTLRLHPLDDHEETASLVVKDKLNETFNEAQYFDATEWDAP